MALPSFRTSPHIGPLAELGASNLLTGGATILQQDYQQKILIYPLSLPVFTKVTVLTVYHHEFSQKVKHHVVILTAIKDNPSNLQKLKRDLKLNQMKVVLKLCLHRTLPPHDPNH